jgi:hypothetical protein
VVSLEVLGILDNNMYTEHLDQIPEHFDPTNWTPFSTDTYSSELAKLV